MADHGSIHWSELATRDVEAAKAYYQSTCGWSAEDMPMPEGTYWVCSSGGKPVAGIMDLAGIGDPNIPPHWMTYIAVDDVDKAAAQTREAGGEVAREPFDVPGVGRIAMLKDPTGAMIGMMTPASG